MKFVLFILFALLLSTANAADLKTFQYGNPGLGILPQIVMHDTTGCWFYNVFDTARNNIQTTVYRNGVFRTLSARKGDIPSDSLRVSYTVQNSSSFILQYGKILPNNFWVFFPNADSCFHIDGTSLNASRFVSYTKGTGNYYWFTTYSRSRATDTLLRYDVSNNSWTVYDTTISELHDGNITSYCTDQHGNVWVNHNYSSPKSNSSVSRMDSAGNWVSYSRKTVWDNVNKKWYIDVKGDSAFVSPIVNSMNEDKKGNVWFGCWNSVTRFDGSHFFSYVIDTTIYPKDYFGNFQQTSSGDTVWFSSDSGYTAMWDGDTMQFYRQAEAFPDINCKYQFIDKNGDRWISHTTWIMDSWNGNWSHTPIRNAVYSIKTKDWFVFDTCSWWDTTIQSVIDVRSTYAPNGIYSKVGGIWYYSNKKNADSIPYNELFYVDRTGYKRFNYYNTGLASDTISAIGSTAQFDYFAHKFGLSYRNRQDSSWNCWRIEDFVSNGNFLIDSVSALTTDKSGSLWVGTNSTYSAIPLARFDGSSWEFIDSAELGTSQVRSLATGSDGSVWIGTAKGVTRYVAGTFTRFDTVPLVNAITTGKDGVNWCATDSGVWKYDGTWARVIDGSFRSVAVDTNGVAWFGNGSSSIVRVTGSTVDTVTTGVSESAISVLTGDTFGNIWVGTNNGVCKWDGSLWSVIDSSNSELQSNQIGSIAIGADGSKWFGTRFNGLAHLVDEQFVGTVAKPAVKSVAPNLTVVGNEIRFSGTGAASLTLFDLRGRVVFNQNWADLNGSASVIPSVGKGVYVARLNVHGLVVGMKIKL